MTVAAATEIPAHLITLPHSGSVTQVYICVMRLVGGLVSVGALFAAGGVSAQQRVSRDDAIAAAVARGPRVAFAAADPTAALGQLHSARAFPNPTFSASYTKSAPSAASIPLTLILTIFVMSRLGHPRLVHDPGDWQVEKKEFPIS